MIAAVIIFGLSALALAIKLIGIVPDTGAITKLDISYIAVVGSISFILGAIYLLVSSDDMCNDYEKFSKGKTSFILGAILIAITFLLILYLCKANV